MKSPEPVLSIVAPCFREEGNLDELYKRLTAVCSRLGISYEIVLVDDGSPDETWGRIRTLAESDSSVRGIRLSRNFGHQYAVSAGLAKARGQRVLIMDADLQDPPELLPEMMAMMDAGVENVYGCRSKRKGVSFWKRSAYKIFYKILRFLAGSDIPEDTGDFRLISRKVVNAINAMPERHRFLRGMMSWTGFEQKAVFYDRDPRFSGTPGYTLVKLFCLALDGITGFSILPLRLATFFGLGIGVLAMLFAAYVVVATLVLGQPVAGWASLFVAVLFIGSLQLFVLGIIGEYLGRLFLESKGRPLFFISEETADPAHPGS